MKVVLFGAGGFYQAVKKNMPSQVEVVAFLDNNPRLQGSCLDGIRIMAPEEVHQTGYEKIILTSEKEREMKSQLLSLGVAKKDIWYWEFFLSEMNHGTLRLFCRNSAMVQTGKRILVISTYLDYNGGSVAAVHAAQALCSRGHAVALAVPDGNQAFIGETVEKGIPVVLCPALPYVHEEELLWIRQFDVVLVNVFQMIFSACAVSRVRPVMWWIHEPGELYGKILDRFEGYDGMDFLKRVSPYAVSSIAQRNFHTCFPGRIEETLAYGIPDERSGEEPYQQSGPLVFAVIGPASERKGQDIFLEALEMLSPRDREKVQCWLIGNVWEDAYGRWIKDQVSHNAAVEFRGVLTREEMKSAYGKIDVVVCPSREEPMSLATTEGMMHGKVCIVSDSTGMADYITDGVNGLICRTRDVKELSEKLRWTVTNREKLREIGKEARLTYERHFSMESFGERLEKALQKTAEAYEKLSESSAHV